MISYKDYLLLWFKCCINDLQTQLSSSPATIPYSPLSMFVQKHGIISGSKVTSSAFMQDFLALVNPREFPPLEPICVSDPTSSIDKMVCILMQLKGFFKRHGLVSVSYFSYLRKHMDNSEIAWEMLHLIFLVTFLSKSSGGTFITQQITKFFNDLFQSAGSTDGVLLQTTIWMLNEGLQKFKGGSELETSSLKGYEELSQVITKESFKETVISFPLPIPFKNKAVTTENCPEIKPAIPQKQNTDATIIKKLKVELKEKVKEIMRLKDEVKETESLLHDYQQVHKTLEDKLNNYENIEELYKESLLEIGELQVKLRGMDRIKEELEKTINDNMDLRETLKFYKNENSNLRNTIVPSPPLEKTNDSYTFLRSPKCSSDSSSTPTSERRSPANLEKQLVEKFFLTQTAAVSTQTEQTGDTFGKMVESFQKLSKEQSVHQAILCRFKETIKSLKATCRKYRQEYLAILQLARQIRNRYLVATEERGREERCESVGKTTLGVLLTGIICAASASITYLACKHTQSILCNDIRFPFMLFTSIACI
eukprot:TRINITY_DN458_c0_g1_i1.p1 TRINITY_DN458_c0_g1~~TRINITY_DN458_c0_g1_i1.p1  ORF type:complete len:539 (-),score=47.91 TRINITY_DN458_c0_g1_i1:17-1633(-)